MLCCSKRKPQRDFRHLFASAKPSYIKVIRLSKRQGRYNPNGSRANGIQSFCKAAFAYTVHTIAVCCNRLQEGGGNLLAYYLFLPLLESGTSMRQQGSEIPTVYGLAGKRALNAKYHYKQSQGKTYRKRQITWTALHNGSCPYIASEPVNHPHKFAFHYNTL